MNPGADGLVLSFSAPSPDEFRALYAQTGWGDLSREGAERALAGSWIVCCARDARGALVAMARVLGDGVLHAFVTELVVREDRRGGGVGGRVLRHVVAESRRRGVTDVQLFAARGRRDFYERNGFTERPTDGPGMEVAPAGATRADGR